MINLIVFISLVIFFQSLLYNDFFIERLATQKKTISSHFAGVIYLIKSELIKNILSLLLSLISMTIINMIIKIPNEFSSDYETVMYKKPMHLEDYNRKMLKRSIAWYGLTIFVFCICFYYCTAFGGVYKLTNVEVLVNSIILIAIDFLILQCIWLTLKAALRRSSLKTFASYFDCFY